MKDLFNFFKKSAWFEYPLIVIFLIVLSPLFLCLWFFQNITFWKVNLLGLIIVATFGLGLYKYHNAQKIVYQKPNIVFGTIAIEAIPLVPNAPLSLFNLDKCPDGFECQISGNILTFIPKNPIPWPTTFKEAEKEWPELSNYESITLNDYNNNTKETRRISIAYPYVQSLLNKPVNFSHMEGDFYEVRLKNSTSCWIAEIPFFTEEKPEIRPCVGGK